MSPPGADHQDPGVASSVRWLHYALPVALGGSIPAVVHRVTGQALFLPGLAFLLLGIAAAYALDRLLDGPEGGEGARFRPLLAACFRLSAILGVGLIPWLPAQSLALVLLLGASALGYRRWKRLPFAKALGVPLAWTWAGMTLPFAPHSWFGWRTLLDPVALTLFLLLAAGCLLCDLKDEEADGRAGIRSFPVMFGARWTAVLAMILAAGAVLRAGAAHRPGLAASGTALILLGCFPRWTARGVRGALVVDAALILPGVLTLTHLV
ncbi:UbiA family prenyltransferase [Geothrix sp.]|jgi:4-hydroxybenzoate polyprenyltransferase|uniref:UbiA family prenyltransferase n=1 Tax=Geothrix sp. TaxID=1962974 RepID=UPI0025BA79D0|nr:UbiA family prenyltransferase [Geothrix sp.]